MTFLVDLLLMPIHVHGVWQATGKTQQSRAEGTNMEDRRRDPSDHEVAPHDDKSMDQHMENSTAMKSLCFSEEAQSSVNYTSRAQQSRHLRQTV